MALVSTNLGKRSGLLLIVALLAASALPLLPHQLLRLRCYALHAPRRVHSLSACARAALAPCRDFPASLAPGAHAMAALRCECAASTHPRIHQVLRLAHSLSGQR